MITPLTWGYNVKEVTLNLLKLVVNSGKEIAVEIGWGGMKLPLKLLLQVYYLESQ